MDDWITYLEAEPKSEPFLSIAAAWKADKARLAEAEALMKKILQLSYGIPSYLRDEAIAFLAADSASGEGEK